MEDINEVQNNRLVKFHDNLLLKHNDMHHQVTELQYALKLIDGEKRMFNDTTNRHLKNLHRRIRYLRNINQELRKRLANQSQHDGFLVNEIFQNKSLEIPPNKKLTLNDAVEALDDRVLCTVKKLNLLKYQSRYKAEKLKNVENELKLLQDGEIHMNHELRHGNKSLAQVIRIIENKIEKVSMKHEEIQTIGDTYAEIRNKLIQEAPTYFHSVDKLELEIQANYTKLAELKRLYKKAVTTRDAVYSELDRQSQLINAKEDLLKTELINLIKTVENRRSKPIVVKSPMFTEMNEVDEILVVEGEEDDDDDKSEKGKTSLRKIKKQDELEQRLAFYELLFNQIKSITGIDNLKMSLLEKKLSNENELRQLQRKHLRLKKKYTELMMNYSREAYHNMSLQNQLNLMKESHSLKTKQLNEEIQNLQMLQLTLRFSIHQLYYKMLLIVNNREEKYKIDLESNPVDILKKCLDMHAELKKAVENIDQVKDGRIHSVKNEVIKTRDEIRNLLYNRISANTVQVNTMQLDDFKQAENEKHQEDSNAPTREELKRESYLIIHRQIKQTN
uniref:Uncharacterized protein n=1 Tax=Trichobilharzia regenti TaxID=157069 RepID=A0AA85KA33_TRIRE|nr:unnamed protein product [Trichobilharzia regenti]